MNEEGIVKERKSNLKQIWFLVLFRKKIKNLFRINFCIDFLFLNQFHKKKKSFVLLCFSFSNIYFSRKKYLKNRKRISALCFFIVEVFPFVFEAPVYFGCDLFLGLCFFFFKFKFQPNTIPSSSLTNSRLFDFA